MKGSVRLYFFLGNNFGDALSSQLIEELSGLKAIYRVPVSLLEYIRCCLYFLRKLQFSKINELCFPGTQVLLSIGSILKYSTSSCLVWGSGFMNEKEPAVDGTFLALRGEESRKKLESVGKNVDGIPLGDPALLLPLWINGEHDVKHKLGIIPHYSEYDYFQKKFGSRFHIIDLRTGDVRRVVNEITSCERILSTSLHGIIVAHAYQIPALWIERGYIDTDGFKFNDYFSSVGISYYRGFRNIDEILSAELTIDRLFEDNHDKAMIQKSLLEIQLGLLKSAPFPLKEKYSLLKKEALE